MPTSSLNPASENFDHVDRNGDAIVSIPLEDLSSTQYDNTYSSAQITPPDTIHLPRSTYGHDVSNVGLLQDIYSSSYTGHDSSRGDEESNIGIIQALTLTDTRPRTEREGLNTNANSTNTDTAENVEAGVEQNTSTVSEDEITSTSTYKPLIPYVRFKQPSYISSERYPTYNDNRTFRWTSAICVSVILGCAVAASFGSDYYFPTQTTTDGPEQGGFEGEGNEDYHVGKDGKGDCYSFEKDC
ncbi:hypothetical protein V865_006874 [Kwoniella europaea PYCC6329]|uniref:Uncharacterized protein n=1 Tax=Kwoniella europaea PYCC6329 TaxID=1423913 RepID=A0AAX4KQP7_9TREE